MHIFNHKSTEVPIKWKSATKLQHSNESATLIMPKIQGNVLNLHHIIYIRKNGDEIQGAGIGLGRHADE